MGELVSVPPKGERPRLWVHAVSVGEVVAVRPILRELRKALPKHEIVLSVTTSSGHRTAREGEQGLFDYLTYFPIDVARFQLAAMQRVRPDAVAIMETELWMNFLWAAKVFDARTLLINGRISDRAYPRDKAVSFLFRAMLRSLDRALMQTELDADRIRSLGASNPEVLGNSKFDQALEAVDASPGEWRKELQIPETDRVLVIGSTRGEFEEELVISAVASVGLEALSVIHAPRHLESAPALIERVRKQFGSVAIRSRGETGKYLVLDTYGELAKVYCVADLVVVGGGFADMGGQNIVQPLAIGKPVIHGPNMQNFREVARAADRAGAAIVAATIQELSEAIKGLLTDDTQRAQMGEAAKALVAANAGASLRYAEAVANEIRDNPPPPRIKKQKPA
jgi:3-deoxy-D-manno-octulosonic-acid transferase